MKQRGVTQTAVCIQLSLSPVYLSMWLSTPGGPVTPDQLAASAAAGSHKAAPRAEQKDGIPKQTRDLYSAAVELWLDVRPAPLLNPRNYVQCRAESLLR